MAEDISTLRRGSGPLIRSATMKFLCFAVLLVLPAAADEALHGRWEGTVVNADDEPAATTWIFGPDGSFESVYQLDTQTEVEAEDDTTQLWPEDLPEDMQVEFTQMFEEMDAFNQLDQMSVFGTYETKGTNLEIQHKRAEITVNGETVDYIEYVVPIFTWSFRLFFSALAMIEYSDLPEEEVVEKFIEYYELIPSDPEFQKLMAEYTLEIRQSVRFLLSGDYSLENGTLHYTGSVFHDGTQDEPFDYEFHRVSDIPSAVRQTTWGTIKEQTLKHPISN